MHYSDYKLNHFIISKRTFFKEERNKDFVEKFIKLDLPITQVYSPTCPLLLLMLCDINSENCFFLPNTECDYLNLSDILVASKFLIFTIGLFVIVDLRPFHTVTSYQNSTLTTGARVASASHAGSVLQWHNVYTHYHENRSHGLTFDTDRNTPAHKHVHNTLATSLCHKSACNVIRSGASCVCVCVCVCVCIYIYIYI